MEIHEIDHRDPVVANAWLETLLDAVDLLPADVIQRDIVAVAIDKAQELILRISISAEKF
jgi:hypothetical protein